MAKTLSQRLKQFLEDNDALQKFWAKSKLVNPSFYNQSKDKFSKI
jgi:hypothetical protein